MTNLLPVSVIMTVYNGESYVCRSVESIRQQTLPDFEMIIVDDGSTDKTPLLLAGLSERDGRIRVITGGRVGRARALNIAWRQSRGAYIANLDADDWAEPTRLEKQLAFIRERPELGLVGTVCRLVDEATGEEGVEKRPLQDAELRRTLVRVNPFVHSSVMMPRHVLEAMGGYNERFRKCIDYELWVRIARRYTIANMPDVLTTKRVHGDAYFRHRLPVQEKIKAHFKIRWRAWWAFSRSLPELRFVFREPAAWWVRQILPGKKGAARQQST